MNRFERALAAGAKRPANAPEGWRFVGGKDLSDEKQFATEFCVSPDKVNAVRGVCWSSKPDYSVSMRAVWFVGGDFWELEASHCSCNGYEDCWGPKKVSAAYIRKLAAKGGNYNEFLCPEFIDGLLWVVGDQDEQH